MAASCSAGGSCCSSRSAVLRRSASCAPTKTRLHWLNTPDDSYRQEICLRTKNAGQGTYDEAEEWVGIVIVDVILSVTHRKQIVAIGKVRPLAGPLRHCLQLLQVKDVRATAGRRIKVKQVAMCGQRCNGCCSLAGGKGNLGFIALAAPIPWRHRHVRLEEDRIGEGGSAGGGRLGRARRRWHRGSRRAPTVACKRRRERMKKNKGSR